MTFSSFKPLFTTMVAFLILQLRSFAEFDSFQQFLFKGWNHETDRQDDSTKDANVAGIDTDGNHSPNQELIND